MTHRRCPHRLVALAGVVAACLVLALTVAAQTPGAAAPASPSVECKAVLDKIVLSKKAKVGDPVSAHVTDTVKLKSGTEIPKGSHLLGKVTEVKAKADSEGPAKVGLLFDKAKLKDGTEVSIALALVSVAPRWEPSGVDQVAADNKMSGAQRTEAMSGNSAQASAPDGATGSLANAGLGIRAGRQSHDDAAMQPGVSYLEGISIASYSSAEPGTILVAPKGSFYVDSGYRLLLIEP